MGRAVWIKLNDTRVRTDRVCGQAQEWWQVAAALINLYEVPCGYDFPEMGLDDYEFW